MAPRKLVSRADRAQKNPRAPVVTDARGFIEGLYIWGG